MYSYQCWGAGAESRFFLEGAGANKFLYRDAAAVKPIYREPGPVKTPRNGS